MASPHFQQLSNPQDGTSASRRRPQAAIANLTTVTRFTELLVDGRRNRRRYATAVVGAVDRGDGKACR
jgi:hypothetical protein